MPLPDAAASAEPDKVSAGPPVADLASPGPSFPVIGVGASAGGMEAFQVLLQHLPPQPGLALVLVQHLDPHHESLLTDILSRSSPLPVQEAKHGLRVEPDHVYVIPPNTYLSIAHGILFLQPREEQPGPNMPIDCFFRSLADDLESRAAGVVLSGGGTDGTLGLEAIKAAGGITFAQEEQTARQSSMPRSAIASGCIDVVLPVEGIAQELARLGSHPYLASTPALGMDEAPPEKNEDDLTRLFALVRAQTGLDFTHYKRSTLQRRLQRRMALRGISDFGELLRRVQEEPAEAQALFQDFLIRVTSFFRDPGAFEVLQKSVFPGLVENRTSESPIRIWVPGCSSGEEAYSLAISLLEVLGDRAASTPIKILATDVNEEVLTKARKGIYLENIVQDVSPERLRRFFLKVNGQYQIHKAVRDLCVFARHNVFADPPFARMDLISCRNLLIYLDASLQKRVLAHLHYALLPNGFLLLGPSETIGTCTDLFTRADPEQRLYARTLTPSRLHLDVSGGVTGVIRPGQGSPAALVAEPGGLLDLQREADRILARYAPAGVLIDEALHILQFRGDTAPYLRHAPGTASLDLPSMAREGLLTELKKSIASARADLRPVCKEGIPLSSEGQVRSVTLRIIPVRTSTSGSGCFLVLFEDDTRPEWSARQPIGLEKEASLGTKEEIDQRLVLLQQELDATREHMQAVIEEYEATGEELKSLNEEMQASNEELQSTNEELQTAREEMQSANEELETVNEELQYRNREQHEINDDLLNLLAGVYIPIIMVNRDLLLRRFTAQAERLFHLIPTDVGRPLRDIRSELNGPDLSQIIPGVIETLSPAAFEVQDQAGHWHSLRIRPYQTLENKIDGAVITLIDIDAIKRGEQQLRESRDLIHSILDTVQESLVVLDREFHVKTANDAFLAMCQIPLQAMIHQLLFDLSGGLWNLPALRVLLEGVRSNTRTVEDVELENSFPDRGPRMLRVNIRPISPDQMPHSPLLLLAIEDITERKQSETALKKSEEQYRALAESLPQIVWMTDPEGRMEYLNRRWTEYTGQKMQESFGENWQKVMYPDDQSACLAKWAHSLQTGEVFETECRLRRTDGTYRWHVARGWPVRSEKGQISRWFGTSSDIDDQKRASDAFHFLASLSETLASLTDSKGILQKVPPRCVPFLADWCVVSLTGEDGQIRRLAAAHADPSKEPVVDRLLAGPPLRQTSAAALVQVVQTGLPHLIPLVSEAQILAGEPDDESCRLIQELGCQSYLCVPLTVDHRTMGTIELVRTASGHPYAAAELALAEDLAGRVSVLVEKAHLYEELRDADRRKNEFLAMLGHELRNPLAPVLNALHLLKMPGLDAQTREQAQGVLNRQVHHLVRLVDDLLDVSRITQGTIVLRKEKVDLASVVARAVEAAQPLIDGFGHELSVILPSEPVVLEVDVLRLCQVISNLLINAGKYSDRAGHITLTAGREGKEVVIRVKDTGIGIAPELLPRIFDLFTQAERSLDRSQGGLGLGLTVVKRMVELHGGTVSALSEGLGKGSELVVRLPTLLNEEQSNQEEQGEQSILPLASHRRRILVVEDNVDAAETLTLLLRLWGHEVQTVHDSRTAQKVAGHFAPDVMLLDLGLPEVSGLELAKEFRKQPEFHETLLIAMTGYGREEDHQRSLEAGFDAHLTKPASLAELHRLLEPVPSE